MKKKFKVTTDSEYNHLISPNRLNRDFSASAPNEKWVSDITYIWKSEGLLYLCVMIDLYSRKVVGWYRGSRIDTNLLLMAFWRAVQIRRAGKALIFHSDRGSQYNACAETFFNSLKSEWLYDEIYKTRQEANNDLFEYIEVFYNRSRIHSAIGYKIPSGYEIIDVA